MLKVNVDLTHPLCFLCLWLFAANDIAHGRCTKKFIDSKRFSPGGPHTHWATYDRNITLVGWDDDTAHLRGMREEKNLISKSGEKIERETEQTNKCECIFFSPPETLCAWLFPFFILWCREEKYIGRICRRCFRTQREILFFFLRCTISCLSLHLPNQDLNGLLWRFFACFLGLPFKISCGKQHFSCLKTYRCV